MATETPPPQTDQPAAPPAGTGPSIPPTDVTARKADGHTKVTFPEVLKEELNDIDKRRNEHGLPPTPKSAATAEQRAQQGGLVGLALSGGGIRSATFSLG